MAYHHFRPPGLSSFSATQACSARAALCATTPLLRSLELWSLSSRALTLDELQAALATAAEAPRDAAAGGEELRTVVVTPMG